MCTGLELLGAVAGVAGSAITANEQSKNAQRMAQARNDELKKHLLKNDSLAQESRQDFAQRNAEMANKGLEQDQQQQTQQREADMTAAVESTPAPEQMAIEGASTSGSAPQVVRQEMARRIGDALTQSKEQAKASAKLGGFGDAWTQQCFKDVAANRDISVAANFAAGNSALLPHQQDIAETRAYKPISPIGGILSGFGGMLGSMGGGGVSRAPRVDPWRGLR